MWSWTYFEYIGPTKDLIFYEYKYSKELFDETKNSQIKFSEIKNKQNEFWNKVSEIKIVKKNCQTKRND